MKKIKTFEAGCKALGIKPRLPDVSKLPKKHQAAMIAFYKLTTIAEALNEGWKPNWKNDSEWKWYPWFDASSGFCFAYTLYGSSGTHVGSRLCFKSSELAEYAGTKFKKLYKDYLML